MSKVIDLQAFRDRRESEAIAEKVVAIDGRAITVAYNAEQFDLPEWIEWVPPPAKIPQPYPYKMRITTGAIAPKKSSPFVMDCWSNGA